MIGQLRYRKRDCHSLLRLVNLSSQFTGEMGFELVKSHRRLIRSKKVSCCLVSLLSQSLNEDAV